MGRPSLFLPFIRGRTKERSDLNSLLAEFLCTLQSDGEATRAHGHERPHIHTGRRHTTVSHGRGALTTCLPAPPHPPRAAPLEPFSPRSAGSDRHPPFVLRAPARRRGLHGRPGLAAPAPHALGAIHARSSSKGQKQPELRPGTAPGRTRPRRRAARTHPLSARAKCGPGALAQARAAPAPAGRGEPLRNWGGTPPVPPPVLTGHVSSLFPY